MIDSGIEDTIVVKIDVLVKNREIVIRKHKN